jgi:hypothetical protein
MFTALVKNLEKLLAQRREEKRQRRIEKNREEKNLCPLTRTQDAFAGRLKRNSLTRLQKARGRQKPGGE